MARLALLIITVAAVLLCSCSIICVASQQQQQGSGSMTAPYVEIANKDGVKVQEQTGANWENKRQRGIEIEKAGDAAEGGGKMSARKVTGMNNAAVLSALEEVDRAQETMNAGGD